MDQDTPAPLPQLQQADLDERGLDTLVSDILCLCDVHEVRLKRGAERRADETPSDLRSAQALLLGGEVTALQVRYSHKGQTWLDTLTRTASGARLVRIAMPMGAPT